MHIFPVMIASLVPMNRPRFGMRWQPSTGVSARSLLDHSRWSTVLADFEYAYVDGANNGRISRFKDWVTGEEVNYLYDSLNRLNRAETTGPEWGQSFTYDGFGNLAAETATKGVAPSYTLQYDWATNRIVSSGFAYDANGNLTSIPGIGTVSYDVFNRYQGSTPGTAGRFYRDDNKLLARYVASTGTWEVYYYGPTGLLESVWGWQSPSPGVYTFNHVRQYDYFAGRRVEMGRLTDRLGSVRALVSAAAPTIRLAGYSYYPYGQERQVTSGDQYKFATYFRESNGLDYADQRYYHSEWGRFLTPDPYQASAGPEDPESWNRYSYVRNDPINRADPSGLDDISAEFGEILFQITVTEITYPLPSYGGGADRWRSGPNLEMYSDPISYFSSGGGGGRAEEIKLTVSNFSKTGPKQAAIWNTLALMKAAFINGVDPDCENWLAGVVGHIEQLLGTTGRPEDSYLGHGVFSDPRVNAFTGITATNVRDGEAIIVVNDNGAFFSSRQSTANGKIRGGTFQARVFIMLHELAHSLEIKGFEKDFGNDAVGKANNKLVLKHCEKMLKWAK